MSEFTILFTSSGRRVSLIKHFKEVFHTINVEGKIITADLKKTSPAGFISDVHVIVPNVFSEAYIASLLSICRKHKVSLIIPLIDLELEVLSNHKYLFEEIGVTILVSSPEVNEICLNKRKTSKFFIEAGFNTPKEYDIREVLHQDTENFPLIIKPAMGSSSIGVYLIYNKKELEFFAGYLEDPILQELVDGEEYTIDVLVDFNGEILTAVPRLRMETRAGEVSKGMTVRHDLLIESTKQMVSQLHGIIGCITVQCFVTKNNDIKFIEINPRFGGGFPLTLEAGADYPRYLIENFLGIPSNLNINNWREGLVMLRYDDAIFASRKEIE